MSIKYTPEYNKEIRKAVKHFNTVRKTLSKRGIKITPPPMKVSELKARYQTRSELNKELTLLNKLSSKNPNVLREVENSGGATAIKWDLAYLKQNAKNAIRYFEWEKEVEESKNPTYPHEKMRLNEIEANLEYLNLDLDFMNQEQFKSYKSAIHEYFRIQQQMSRGYRGFLYQVETSMRMVGYSEKEINRLFDKLKVLNPPQFMELYRTNNLINRIYELVNSPKHGESKLTLNEDDARELLDTLIEEIDDDIAKVTK